MRIATSISVLALAAASFASAAFAQAPPSGKEFGADNLALVTLPAKAGAKPLTVTAGAFKAGEDIPFENTQWRTNTFPGLKWSKGPDGTKSYVIIMQDPDIQRPMPVLHWTMYNIPASMTELKAGMTELPTGAAYGPNYQGPAHAYAGPRTPAGPKHRYHFQIFALDTTITEDPKITYDAMRTAMTGHVLASGEVMGLGQVDPTAPPPPPRPSPSATPSAAPTSSN